MRERFFSKKKAPVLLAWFVVTIIYFVYRESVDYSYATTDSVWLASLVTVLVYLFAIVLWCVYTKKPLSIYFVFLVCCFLFNAGEMLIGIFDTSFVAEVNIYKQYSNGLLLKTMLFQCDGVLAMTLGALVAFRPKPYKKSEESPTLAKKASHLNVTDYLFLFIAIALFVVYLREVVLRGTASYGDYYYGEREGISIPLLFLYHVFMYKVLIDHEKDLMSKITMVVNIVIAAMMLMVGSRNAILQILFGSIFILFYVRQNRIKLNLVKTIIIVIVALVGTVIMTGFQELRGYTLSELSWETVVSVYEGNFTDKIVDALAQMGGSARCLLKTTELIDRGYVEGEITVLYVLLKSFIFLPILNFLGIHPPTIQSLAAWITYEGGSEFGWGYSIFAEAYYNFQEWGFVYLFVWGFVFVWLEGKALSLIKKNRKWEGCAIIYVLAYGIFIARADFTLLTSRLRYTMYLFIICFIFRLFWKYYKRKPNYD